MNAFHVIIRTHVSAVRLLSVVIAAVGRIASFMRPGGPAIAALIVFSVFAGPAPTSVTASAVPVGHMVTDPKTDIPVKFYRVRTDFGGQPEFLYEIAQRFLGSGDRGQEIFDRNVGRIQPDGLKMVTLTEIKPGWILVLPPDAHGDGVEIGVLPRGPVAGTDINPAAGKATSRSTDSGGGSVLLSVVVVAVVVLAVAAIGLVLLRRSRTGPVVLSWGGRFRFAIPGSGAGAPARRPLALTSAPAPAPDPGRVAGRSFGQVFGWVRRGARGAAVYTRHFDTAASWTVDRALRALTTACAESGRDAPGFYAVDFDSSRVRLRLAAPDEAPPPPWLVADGGRSWEAPLRALQALPVDPDDDLSRLRLVTLGTADGNRVLVDLGQSTGVIRLDGDAAAARALAGAWATELAANPWSTSIRVIAAGLAVDAHERVTAVPGVREALGAVEAGSGTGEDSRPESAPGVLLLDCWLSAREVAQVQALASRPDSAWAVVVVGGRTPARWRFTAHADGRLDTGVLGISVYAASVTGTGR